MMYTDTYRHKGLRKKLVVNLRTKGINDERILQAFMDIPRHFFIEPAFADWAYKDVPFKIDADQTISQPFTVASMTQLLEPVEGQTALEVGTGSGFQACVLSYLGMKVYSIERQETLYTKTQKLLNDIGYDTIRTLVGDGYQGNERFAPYDKIIVTAGANHIPHDLLKQMKIGGILVIPVNTPDGENQEMIKIVRKSKTDYIKSSHGLYKFVPMLPGTQS